MRIRLHRKTLVWPVVILLAAVSALPGLAADEGRLRGEIDIGLHLLDLDGSSYKHGEYSGADRDGIYFTGALDLRYSRGSRYYLDLKADRLGYDSRVIRLDTGLYGGYKLSVGYAEIPHLISNSSSTPFYGVGEKRLTLPAGFVTASTTSGMTTLPSSLKDVKLELDRKTSTIGFAAPLRSGVDFKMTFKNERKEGVKSVGGPLGSEGSSSVVLPEPVDYSTSEITASIAYKGEEANVDFKYHLSVFDNNSESLTWDAPFIKFVALSPDFPAIARTSLPPGNRYQNFSLSGGINLGNSARISAIAEYGIMEQDADLLPYTINPASTVGTPLPRRTAEAEIDVRHLEVNLWTRPLKGLDVNTRYRYYETGNRTPSDLFRGVFNDTGNQAAPDGDTAAYNLPFDLKQNRINVDATCRLGQRTTFRAGYELDDVQRSYREISRIRENTYTAKLTTRPNLSTSLTLNYAYGERRGGRYQESRVFEALHTQDYINTLTPDVRFDNHPDTRKFDIADRDRTRYGANLSISGISDAVIGIYYDHREDEYRKSVFGLRSTESDAFTVDLTMTPADFATIHAFYTYEHLSSSMNSRSYGEGPSKAVQSSDPTRNWSVEQNDRNDTVGVGVDFLLLSRRLTIGMDYTLERSITDTGFTAGSALEAPARMPELTTLQHRVGVKARYMVSRDKTIGLEYKYENYSSDDWSTDGLDYATIAQVLPLSLSVKDYEAHAVYLTFTYRFDSGN